MSRGDAETSPGATSRPGIGNGFAGAQLQGLAGGMQRSGVSGILDEMSLDSLAPQIGSGIGPPSPNLNPIPKPKPKPKPKPNPNPDRNPDPDPNPNPNPSPHQARAWVLRTSPVSSSRRARPRTP